MMFANCPFEWEFIIIEQAMNGNWQPLSGPVHPHSSPVPAPFTVERGPVEWPVHGKFFDAGV